MKYSEYLPVWSFKVACGKNWRLQLAESLGWMKCEHVGKLDKTKFVVHVEGDSMTGLVEDGEYCVMRKLGSGSMENKTLLIQEYDAAGSEDGGAYVLKKFTRKDGKLVLAWARAICCPKSAQSGQCAQERGGQNDGSDWMQVEVYGGTVEKHE